MGRASWARATAAFEDGGRAYPWRRKAVIMGGMKGVHVMDHTAMGEEYARGGGLLLPAIQGLSAADFAATPVAGTWSINQIVLHVMDSDLIASDRMKRMIAEENPTII